MNRRASTAGGPVPLLDLQAQFAAHREELLEALLSVVTSQRFIMGEAVGALEEAIASYCGTSHAIACASGTDALLLSVKALGLEPGDEVVTTPFTFFATAGAIVNGGGRPVFVDVEPETLNIDPAAVEAALTSRTRALVPVHLFGQMAAMESLGRLSAARDLAVIEDAAQAIGARRRMEGDWVRAGAVGTTGAFSFFPSKNLGGWGDGGMVVTDSAALAEQLRLLRTHGGAKQYHHDVVGTNSRLDTLQAAVLGVKLRYLEEWNAARRAHAAAYTEAFADVDAVRPLAVDPRNEPVFHQYTVRVERRDALRDHLRGRQIGCAVYYPKPLHLQPCFADLGYRTGQFPVTERATTEVLSLPIYPELPVRHRDCVIATIREFYA